jgi:hypothetical protein
VFENGLFCYECKKPLIEEAYSDADEEFYCEECAAAIVKRTVALAVRYARMFCRLTNELPEYDAAFEPGPSWADYIRGDEPTVSENAYAAFCRHECTNYDRLIKKYDPDSILGRILYWAVRDRIMAMLYELSDDHVFDECY